MKTGFVQLTFTDYQLSVLLIRIGCSAYHSDPGNKPYKGNNAGPDKCKCLVNK